jgi:hypothetical protein
MDNGIDPSYAGLPAPIPTSVTLDDVRMFMIDNVPSDNFLLDAVEFTDEQINKAMNFATDRYNSTPPLLTPLSIERMPHFVLVQGTTAILLRMRAMNYARNRLDYNQKDGAAVQDKNKMQEYLLLSKELMAEFDRSVRELKYAANLNGAYGGVLSPYSWPNTY